MRFKSNLNQIIKLKLQFGFDLNQTECWIELMLFEFNSNDPIDYFYDTINLNDIWSYTWNNENEWSWIWVIICWKIYIKRVRKKRRVVEGRQRQRHWQGRGNWWDGFSCMQGMCRTCCTFDAAASLSLSPFSHALISHHHACAFPCALSLFHVTPLLCWSISPSHAPFWEATTFTWTTSTTSTSTSTSTPTISIYCLSSFV